MSETLREAAEAYVAWQYRQKGARRFTLTDLRAALEAKPSVDLDVELLERASYQCWLRRPRHRATGEELAAEGEVDDAGRSSRRTGAPMGR